MPKVQNDEVRKIKAVPVATPEIGIDVDGTFEDNILTAGTTGQLDISAIEAFTTVSQTRESIYSLIDNMSNDSTIASIIETYAEDTTEANDKKQIVWAESNDGDVGKYVTYLLDKLNVDKYVYSWTHCLVKYGDVYLRLYKESDYENDPIFKKEEKETLHEQVNLNLHKKSDHYVDYVELVRNPGEMFELTRLGKTAGYIQAPTNVQTTQNNEAALATSFMRYNLRRDDVDVYSATDFVHGCLEDNSSRTPEEVDIFLNDEDFNNNKNGCKYSVRRGQSLLYNTFKIWRELSLLEDSVLLNRITKSSIVRTVQVEVGDMPKDKVAIHLNKIKQMIEQKTSINVDNGSYGEYTNPGPVENNIYIPTHEGKGAITTSQIGGDVDPKQLTDLDWFNNKFFAAMRIPKQFFGFTDDAAGFSGGSSLSIISSRYGKAVKRIQNTIIQMVTDLINLLLLDKGLSSYINKFQIKMQAPVTQEEIDRRANVDNRIRYVGDIMNQLTSAWEDPASLKIVKALITPIVNDPAVIDVVQTRIEKLEAEAAGKENPAEAGGGEELGGGGNETLADLAGGAPAGGETGGLELPEEPAETGGTEAPAETAAPAESEESYLPNFEELGVENGTDTSQF